MKTAEDVMDKIDYSLLRVAESSSGPGFKVPREVVLSAALEVALKHGSEFEAAIEERN